LTTWQYLQYQHHWPVLAADMAVQVGQVLADLLVVVAAAMHGRKEPAPLDTLVKDMQADHPVLVQAVSLTIQRQAAVELADQEDQQIPHVVETADLA